MQKSVALSFLWLTIIVLEKEKKIMSALKVLVSYYGDTNKEQYRTLYYFWSVGDFFHSG